MLANINAQPNAAPWRDTGLPGLSLPFLTGAAGLPIGLRLVAGPEEDARLFRTARWLLGRLHGDAVPGEDGEAEDIEP